MDRTQKQMSMLAQRLQNDRRYMAWVLEEYRKKEQISSDALLEKLEIAPERYALLAVCKRPDRESTEFSEQVRQIAAYAKANIAVLGNLIRQVDGLQILTDLSQEQHYPEINGRMAPFSSGLLAAARDQDKEVQEPTDEHEQEEESNSNQHNNEEL